MPYTSSPNSTWRALALGHAQWCLSKTGQSDTRGVTVHHVYNSLQHSKGMVTWHHPVLAPPLDSTQPDRVVCGGALLRQRVWKCEKWENLEDFETSNIEDADEGSAGPLIAIEWAVDALNEPFKHALVEWFRKGFYREFHLPGSNYEAPLHIRSMWKSLGGLETREKKRRMQLPTRAKPNGGDG